MTATATVQIDTFFSGLGIDVLAAIETSVGCSTVFDVDVADVGGNSAPGLFDAATSGQGIVIADVVQTGAAGDDATLLVGAGGVDTMARGEAGPVVTGCNAAATEAAADMGLDTLTPCDAATTTGLSSDLRVSVILHRIAMFSALAPTPVGFPSGHGV